MTADPIPPSGCTICGAKTRVHPDGYVYRPHPSWCAHARPVAPSRLRDPFAVPGTSCYGCGQPTRGADLCSLCQPIALNAMTAIKENLA